MRRVYHLDEQGHRKALEILRRLNAEIQEIEAESAERTGRPLTFPAPRFIALPASADQIAEAKAAELRRRGTPPL